MKITAIDTFTLRIPTVKPIALDFPEHRLVVAKTRARRRIGKAAAPNSFYDKKSIFNALADEVAFHERRPVPSTVRI